MPIATDYPFLNILWTMIIFFVWVVWIWMMITILSDVFRRDDLSGWGKAGWTTFLIVLPFVGAFIYLISQARGMTERSVKEVRGQQEQFDDYVKSVATSGGPAAEIDKAKQLLDSGAINQQEFEAIEAKALASGLASGAAVRDDQVCRDTKQEARAEQVEPELGVPQASDAGPDLADGVEVGAAGQHA
jgi:hypothetical protein